MKDAPEISLDRFLNAQDSGLYGTALTELRAGKKESHWMWFTFPQLRGLSRSPMGTYYGIRDLDEAERYAAHPVLSSRLRECTRILLDLPGSDPCDVLGGADAEKLRSSMTLFRLATGEPEFGRVLIKFFREDDRLCTYTHKHLTGNC